MSVKWSSPSSALIRSFLLFFALFNTEHTLEQYFGLVPHQISL
jgi:hypothetical protein